MPCCRGPVEAAAFLTRYIEHRQFAISEVRLPEIRSYGHRQFHVVGSAGSEGDRLCPNSYGDVEHAE